MLCSRTPQYGGINKVSASAGKAKRAYAIWRMCRLTSTNQDTGTAMSGVVVGEFDPPFGSTLTATALMRVGSTAASET